MPLRTHTGIEISIHLNNSQPTISLLIFFKLCNAWEMPRAAIIHLPRHNRGARIIGGDEKEGGNTHKKVSFIFSFSPNPKDNIPELRRVVQAPILKYHMQRKESKMWEMMKL